MTIVLKGGDVVDETGRRRADVVIDDGAFVAVGEGLDGGGGVAAPGLVPLHAPQREPGREEAETVETGSRAAALGGYTAVLAMPNTEPAIDPAAPVPQVLDAGVAAGLCQVEVSGSITVGRAGTALSPMGEMAAMGVRVFTDDGNGVQ